MAWSKNVLTYPASMREIFERLITTGEPSTHTFPTKTEATTFERNMQGIRYAMMGQKDGPYQAEAASFTTERLDELTVRLCSVNDTARARIGNMALKQRREQDEVKGIGKGLDQIAGDLGS